MKKITTEIHIIRRDEDSKESLFTGTTAECRSYLSANPNCAAIESIPVKTAISLLNKAIGSPKEMSLGHSKDVKLYIIQNAKGENIPCYSTYNEMCSYLSKNPEYSPIMNISLKTAINVLAREMNTVDRNVFVDMMLGKGEKQSREDVISVVTNDIVGIMINERI